MVAIFIYIYAKRDPPKNPWNKGKLQNRYRARWAKGKMGVGLDEHALCKFLHPACAAHCINLCFSLMYGSHVFSVSILHMEYYRTP